MHPERLKGYGINTLRLELQSINPFSVLACELIVCNPCMSEGLTNIKLSFLSGNRGLVKSVWKVIHPMWNNKIIKIRWKKHPPNFASFKVCSSLCVVRWRKKCICIRDIPWFHRDHNCDAVRTTETLWLDHKPWADSVIGRQTVQSKVQSLCK